MTAAALEQRIDPDVLPSALMAGAVHLALVAALVFGVNWQNKAPDVVEVELWEPAPAPAPAPVVQPPPPAPPAPEPPRAAPAPAPEPRIAKPDIVEKAPDKKKVPEKRAPEKPAAKPAPEAAKPRADLEAQKHIQEQLMREQASLAINRERDNLQEQLARDASAARSKGLAEYEAKIRTKVRGNITLPPDLAGNPDAVFLVAQLPTGEVLTAKLVKSSGHRGYDEAVERAILKSSPLPRPDRPELFSRELRLTFRPKD